MVLYFSESLQLRLSLLNFHLSRNSTHDFPFFLTYIHILVGLLFFMGDPHLTLADRKAFRWGLKERTGWSATRFRNLSRAFILVSTNSSEKRSTTPFITNFSGNGWRWEDDGRAGTRPECKRERERFLIGKWHSWLQQSSCNLLGWGGSAGCPPAWSSASQSPDSAAEQSSPAGQTLSVLSEEEHTQTFLNEILHIKKRKKELEKSSMWQGGKVKQVHERSLLWPSKFYTVCELFCNSLS